ncbi:MAG: PDC sensor domain-containing protein [Myxococcaceae bacterium]
MLVRWPKPPPEHLCSDYSWRDYFDGARRLGEKGRHAVHVSRAFNSELDKQFKFALSTPIYAADGHWTGVIRVAIGTDSTLGPLRLRDPADPRRLGVLVGLKDNERETAGRPRPDDNVVLLHESLEHGANMPIESGPIRDVQAALAARASGDVDEFLMPPPELSRAVEDHRDPVPGFEGRWLAGVAPVGGTRYVVVLQTLDAAALEPGQTLWTLLQWGGGALAAFGLALWVVRRSTRPPKGSPPGAMLARK